MNKTFCIQNPMVCTTGNILTIGEKYMYKEGGNAIAVKLEGVRNTDEMPFLGLFFSDRRKT